MKLWNLTLVAAIILIAGCRHQDTEQSYLTPFVPDGELRRSQEIVNMQAAVGAREDATLYGWHFDGVNLSPLGREKLDFLVQADTYDTVPIYLSVKADTFAGRKASLVAYLKDQGLADSHVNVIEGVNTQMLTPAVSGLAGLAKTDTSESTGLSSSTPSSGQATASMK